MKPIQLIRSLINPFKIDLVKYPDLDLRRRLKLFSYHNINTIIDVGANQGQYASQFLKHGYKGNILSFEPITKVFETLEKNSKTYKNWKVFNYGLSNENKTSQIYISENTFSSSLLKITPSHLINEPKSKTVRSQKVNLKTLDSIYDSFDIKNESVFLKIDVQGYEKEVLEGAKNSLKHIKGIQIEMSIEELYKGEMLFNDMLSYIQKLGFELHSLENGFYSNNSGKLLQVDGVFFKPN